MDPSATGLRTIVGDFLLDLALPRTDRVVFIQWIVMAIFWAAVFIGTRNRNKDIRQFLIGIAMLNLAWFAFRTVH